MIAVSLTAMRITAVPLPWVPVFAGMTIVGGRRLVGKRYPSSILVASPPIAANSAGSVPVIHTWP
jgi:hypothetical protein